MPAENPQCCGDFQQAEPRAEHDKSSPLLAEAGFSSHSWLSPMEFFIAGTAVQHQLFPSSSSSLTSRHPPQNCKLRAEKSVPPAAVSASWSPALGIRSPAVTPAQPATAASSMLFATAGKSAPVSPAARTSTHAAGLPAPCPCVLPPPLQLLIKQLLAKAIAEWELFNVSAWDLGERGSSKVLVPATRWALCPRSQESRAPPCRIK